MRDFAVSGPDWIPRSSGHQCKQEAGQGSLPRMGSPLSRPRKKQFTIIMAASIGGDFHLVRGVSKKSHWSMSLEKCRACPERHCHSANLGQLHLNANLWILLMNSDRIHQVLKNSFLWPFIQCCGLNLKYPLQTHVLNMFSGYAIVLIDHGTLQNGGYLWETFTEGRARSLRVYLSSLFLK